MSRFSAPNCRKNVNYSHFKIFRQINSLVLSLVMHCFHEIFTNIMRVNFVNFYIMYAHGITNAMLYVLSFSCKKFREIDSSRYYVWFPPNWFHDFYFLCILYDAQNSDSLKRYFDCELWSISRKNRFHVIFSIWFFPF